MRTRCFVALVFGLCFCLAAHAQRPEELLKRVEAAETASALDSSEMPPWHLKLAVKLFDDSGQPSDEGSVEEWWKDAGDYRREYATGSYKAVEIRTGGKLYRSRETASPPYLLDLLRDQVVHPVAHADLAFKAVPQLHPLTLGDVEMECVMLAKPVKQIPAPLGLFPTYCLEPGKDAVRANIRLNQESAFRNEVVAFQGKSAASKISVSIGTTAVAIASVETLEAWDGAGEKFALPSDVGEAPPTTVRIASATSSKQLLTRVKPVYPASAQTRQAQGTVVLHAIIGTDGRVHALQVVYTPEVDFAVSAIDAVRQWTYKPYLLNGTAVNVETLLNISYELGR